MLKFGFEREFFLYKKGVISLVPKEGGIPMDECGYLVESRSEPHFDPIKAAFLLLAEEFKLRMEVAKAGYKLVLKPFEIITPEFQRQALRHFGKNALPHERGNLWELELPIEQDIVGRAGLHIHFSNPIDFRDKRHRLVGTASQMIDMVKIIQTLDKAFEKEITDARRIKGNYEMKSGTHGGFEYRSLPANIDVCKVSQILNTLKKC